MTTAERELLIDLAIDVIELLKAAPPQAGWPALVPRERIVRLTRDVEALQREDANARAS